MGLASALAGGVVVFDDYGFSACSGVTKLVDEQRCVTTVSSSTTSTAMGSSSSAERSGRARAYEQHRAHSPVDRFGVWLSARALERHVPSFAGKSVGDFGCGYQARFVRSVLDEIERAVLVDVALAPDVKADERITAIEGVLPDALSGIEVASLDVVLCVNVLEHLWQPLETLVELRRVTAWEVSASSMCRAGAGSGFSNSPRTV